MPNKAFTFIHAADMHLGAPFKGLTQMQAFEYPEGSPGPNSLGNTLFSATYKALNRLVEECLLRRPHALLLAGDLYNPETSGLKSLIALRQAFLKLQEAGIVVCLVHGNHDPANSIPPSWSWPKNVHAFSAENPEAVGVFANAEHGCRLEPMDGSSTQPLAVIYGMSHSSGAVTDNLVKKIAQESLKYSFNSSSIFQIGIAHCAVGTPGAGIGEHKPYAPCSVEDLTSARVNYWALGHIHKQGKISTHPLAIYPGNTQGLHINEQGPKGCVLVALRAGVDPQLTFCPLAEVEWRQVDFELTAQSTASNIGDELFEKLQKLLSSLHLQSYRLQNQNLENQTGLGPAPFTSGYIVRLNLFGRTSLNRYLRENVEDLLASLRERLHNSPGIKGCSFIWLKDIKLNTQPIQNFELASQRDDLLGESLRRLQAAKRNPNLYDELLKDTKSSLGQLFAQSSIRQAGLIAPNLEEWPGLLDEAAVLCAELLGAEEDNLPEQNQQQGQQSPQGQEGPQGSQAPQAPQGSQDQQNQQDPQGQEEPGIDGEDENYLANFSTSKR